MRAVLLGLLVIAAVGVGGYFWAKSRSDSGAARSGVPQVNTAVAKVGDVHFVVSVAGEIGPAEQVSVRPEVNGRINELPVDVGDVVPKGGLLFSLDDRDLAIEVEAREKDIESARLQVDKARISMAQAKRDFDRNQELYELRLLSAQEFENSRRIYESAVKDH